MLDYDRNLAIYIYRLLHDESKQHGSGEEGTKEARKSIMKLKKTFKMLGIMSITTEEEKQMMGNRTRYSIRGRRSQTMRRSRRKSKKLDMNTPFSDLKSPSVISFEEADKAERLSKLT